MILKTLGMMLGFDLQFKETEICLFNMKLDIKSYKI